jgi:hypothetical protein
MRTSTGHQLIDPSQLRCPLFLNASSSGPHAIDLRKLNNQVKRPLFAILSVTDEEISSRNINCTLMIQARLSWK